MSAWWRLALPGRARGSLSGGALQLVFLWLTLARGGWPHVGRPPAVGGVAWRVGRGAWRGWLALAAATWRGAWGVARGVAWPEGGVG